MCVPAQNQPDYLKSSIWLISVVFHHGANEFKLLTSYWQKTRARQIVCAVSWTIDTGVFSCRFLSQLYRILRAVRIQNAMYVHYEGTRPLNLNCTAAKKLSGVFFFFLFSLRLLYLNLFPTNLLCARSSPREVPTRSLIQVLSPSLPCLLSVLFLQYKHKQSLILPRTSWKNQALDLLL